MRVNIVEQKIMQVHLSTFTRESTLFITFEKKKEKSLKKMGYCKTFVILDFDSIQVLTYLGDKDPR